MIALATKAKTLMPTEQSWSFYQQSMPMQRKKGHGATGTTHHTQRSPPDMGVGLGSGGGGGGRRNSREVLWSQQRPTTTTSSLLTQPQNHTRYGEMMMHTGSSGRSHGSGGSGNGGYRDGYMGGMLMDETFKSSALRGVKLSMGTMTLGSTMEEWGN